MHPQEQERRDNSIEKIEHKYKEKLKFDFKINDTL
jgi:hypothetical protein